MSENTKLNIEGSTYVIPGEEPYNEAETKHPQDADWNDFQVMGSDDTEEGEYVPPVDADPKQVAEALKRAKSIRFGRGVLSLFSQTA